MGGGRDFGDFNCGPRTARPRGGTCSRVTYRPFCTSPPTHPLTLKLMGDPVPMAARVASKSSALKALPFAD